MTWYLCVSSLLSSVSSGCLVEISEPKPGVPTGLQVAMPNRSKMDLGVLLLTNRQRFLLPVSTDLHPQHKRYVAHVSHVERLHQLGADFAYQVDIASNHTKIVHIEREDGDDPSWL